MLAFWLKVDSLHRRITDAKLIASVIVTNQVFLAGELQLQIRFVLRIEILKEFFSKNDAFYQMTLSIIEYLSA